MLIAALALTSLVLALALTARVRNLERRIVALTPSEPPLLQKKGPEGLSPLAGLRIGLSIQQDHLNPVLATLLKETLLREGALVDDRSEVSIQGTVVCNGYADIYFRADLFCADGTETVLTLTDKPPHGDRQENLARELVARLKTEWPKRERHSALRELGGP